MLATELTETQEDQLYYAMYALLPPRIFLLVQHQKGNSWDWAAALPCEDSLSEAKSFTKKNQTNYIIRILSEKEYWSTLVNDSSMCWDEIFNQTMIVGTAVPAIIVGITAEMQIVGNLEQCPLTPITIHDKGNTRRGGEMYLSTMKVRASHRMKGMSE